MTRLLVADYLAASKKQRFKLHEFLLYVLKSSGLQVVVLYRLSCYFRKIGLKVISFVLDKLVFHLYACEIRSTCTIGPGFTIAHPTGIVIGGKVVAGRNFSIRQNTTLGGNSGREAEVDGKVFSQPVIGDDVKLGCHVAVLGPIRVADRTIVGAGAVLLTSTALGDVVAGVPAKRIN